MIVFYKNNYIIIATIHYATRQITEAYYSDNGQSLTLKELNDLNNYMESYLCSIFTRKIS